ncbi:MAG: hypothetical protein GXP42_19215 [Chloroflexi bacterium]|nr:hypothetical protein [Chloroflexota bacterium]
MNESLIEQLRAAQQAIEPDFKALRQALAALKRASKLVAEERPDAIAMQKALPKLQDADALVDNEALHAATAAFAAATQEALDALAFEFARDLKATFEARGQSVEGRPPTLVVGDLVLHIDSVARKAQWFYGKETLTRPLPLSLHAILKAYDQQTKAIIRREIDASAFMNELYQAWRQLLAKRSRRPAGGRINIIEVYSQVVLNRQSPRFWRSPSRKTFKDYERAFFVRDLVLAQSDPTVSDGGRTYHLRLGVATKNQADNPQRSLWLPQGPLDGEYYSDVTFEEM